MQHDESMRRFRDMRARRVRQPIETRGFSKASQGSPCSTSTCLYMATMATKYSMLAVTMMAEHGGKHQQSILAVRVMTGDSRQHRWNSCPHQGAPCTLVRRTCRW